ncbi:hypothetical protein M885DRAFT_125520 [Pelagophyceae sp. CCMP2097]|nr:hypothetical protein M885DRAFT_125520 [Pelagophyceae sp. CCMP2097]
MDASGGVLNFFRDGDPVEKCLRDENMRQWVSDATFCAKLREVQRKALAASTPQLVSELTRAIMVDPRLCQCLMSGSGVSVKVDDADLKKAERVGDIEKRSPMVLDDMVGANRAASAADAKAKGNEAYAKGQFALALAFWAREILLRRGSRRKEPSRRREPSRPRPARTTVAQGRCASTARRASPTTPTLPHRTGVPQWRRAGSR